MNSLSVSRTYRMPAEWELHQATWITWPHYRADWSGKFATIPWVYAEIVRHLHLHERVKILVRNNKLEKRARRLLSQSNVNLGQIDFHHMATNRGWLRDAGPIFVRQGQSRSGDVRILNWRFNGWSKYSNCRRDDTIPDKVSRLLGLKQWRPATTNPKRRVVMEGGSIEVNGRGTLLTTEECLLSPIQARNPGLSRDSLETLFHEYLGVRKVIWLGQGIAGDDTNGHIDDFARFVNPTTVVVAVEADSQDVNYSPLRANWKRLQSATDQDNQPLRVVELPMPRPLFFRSHRLPASYANFYIANQTVLVPTFNDPNDRLALAILSRLFPKRTVVGIHSVELVWGLGTLHCLTQQQPV